MRLALPADFRVFLFIILLAIGVTCLFGILPALRASSIQPASALNGGENPHPRRRLMYALIGAQVAFCCLVLSVAGLFVSTFQRLSHQPIGFSPDRLLILDTVTHEPVAATWLQVADRLRSTPGVERVSVSNGALLSGFSNNDDISINGAPPHNTLTYFRNVSPGWLATLQIPLLYGRDFLPSEITPVAVQGTTGNLNGAAIVNQTFATRFFHDEDVVGKSFEEVFPYGQRAHFQIVGVTSDAKYRSIRENTVPVAYLPFLSLDPNAWWSASGATFIVRTSSGNPLAPASMLRRSVSEIRSDFRVSNIYSQNELIERQTIRERLLATLASFFAGVALLLAAVGLYGVLHYSVQQRHREIASCMAVGAEASNIVILVTIPLFVTVVSGAMAGIVAGVFASRYLSSVFFQVRPTDAPMLAVPAIAIMAAGCIVALPATLRALHTDPASTLRAE